MIKKINGSSIPNVDLSNEDLYIKLMDYYGFNIKYRPIISIKDELQVFIYSCGYGITEDGFTDFNLIRVLVSLVLFDVYTNVDLMTSIVESTTTNDIYQVYDNWIEAVKTLENIFPSFVDSKEKILQDVICYSKYLSSATKLFDNILNFTNSSKAQDQLSTFDKIRELTESGNLEILTNALNYQKTKE